jgi:glycosyltransferase involved in cell wall biosynthesis
MAKRLAIYGDTPTGNTGFGRVVRDAFVPLSKHYEVSILGINYRGTPHRLPVDIYPAATFGNKDPYGIEVLPQWLKTIQPDALLIINDAWLLSSWIPPILEKLTIPIIMYFPVDVVETERTYYEWLAKNPNIIPVTYTEWARDVVTDLVPELKERLLVIPHGVDTDVYHPIDPKSQAHSKVMYCKGVNNGKFSFLNVNRNQVRKNIPCSIAAMREYVRFDGCGDDILVLHMLTSEAIGCNIMTVANALKFPTAGTIRVSETPLTDDQLNVLYNACHVVISTSIGEGWGLSISEALAAGVPVIAPNHTSLPEVVREYGILYDPGHLHSALPFGVDRSNFRWYADPTVVARQMYEVKNNYSTYKDMAMLGRAFYTSNRTWKHHIVPRWVSLVKSAIGR